MTAASARAQFTKRSRHAIYEIAERGGELKRCPTAAKTDNRAAKAIALIHLDENPAHQHTLTTLSLSDTLELSLSDKFWR